MSWSYPNDGFDHYAITGIGAAPVAGAPVTVLMMVKPTSADNGFMVASASGTDCYGILATSGGKLFAVNDFSGGGPTLVLNEWQIIGFDDNNAGSGTLRWHHCTGLATTPSWAHQDGPSSGNRSGTPTTFRLGLGAAAFRMRGLIAAAIVVAGRLGDAGVEALGVTTMAAWVAAADAAWQMNVAVGATALEDLTGGTADQSSLVGSPTLSGDDPPNWTYFTGEVLGTAAAALGALTASAAGTRAKAGSGAATLGALTSSATGVKAKAGAAVAAFGRLVASAIGDGAPAGPRVPSRLVVRDTLGAALSIRERPNNLTIREE